MAKSKCIITFESPNKVFLSGEMLCGQILLTLHEEKAVRGANYNLNNFIQLTNSLWNSIFNLLINVTIKSSINISLHIKKLRWKSPEKHIALGMNPAMTALRIPVKNTISTKSLAFRQTEMVYEFLIFTRLHYSFGNFCRTGHPTAWPLLISLRIRIATRYSHLTESAAWLRAILC